MPYPMAAVRNRNFGNPLYSDLVLSLSPLAYWPLNEASGTTAYDQSGNGYNGSYTAVTLGQPGQFGQTCPSFDGSTSYVNIYSAGLNTAWNRSQTSMAGWAKLSASGVWTDGANRRVLYMLTTSSQDGYSIGRPTTNSRFTFVTLLGGTQETVNVDSLSYTGWFHIAVTIDKSGDKMISYINGAQVGAPQTGLGVASANNLASTSCLIGAGTTTPTQVWSGWLQYVGIWNRTLSATEVASLYSWGGA